MDKKRVLIVDDDDETRFVIKHILENNNFSCFICKNGKEALVFLKDNAIDVIIMDIMMPEMDGVTATKIIKNDKNLELIPIIFVSAKHDDETIDFLFNFDNIDYISKPFRNIEIIRRINSLLKITSEKEEFKNLNEKISKKNNKLEKQNKQLEELDDIKDNFLICLTHDFKTPITSIRSLAEIMLDNEDIPNNKKKEFLEKILGQVDKVSEMIDTLLMSFKKISIKLNIEKTKINLEELSYKIYSLFVDIADSKNLKFILNINTNIKDFFSDSNKVEEVLQNILSNSFKFTENGFVSLDIYDNDNYIYFDVIDTGIGIADCEIKNIFEKFYRVKTDEHLKDGAGLGLFIAKRYALNLGGDIIVTSEEKKGSKFSFFIPK
ncbi:MAG: hypothetical protein A2086_16750 [Spirochaetes bacterium GWD1_27_9]|nr:MAG: hypothetical protein A2Y34_11930 [Spirochaetes bacterium GWC1_27_15]OHD31162.1 MAG: hypothetical protein A2086_16750 [Spirochaetes bacterium GWD1_27_9]